MVPRHASFMESCVGDWESLMFHIMMIKNWFLLTRKVNVQQITLIYFMITLWLSLTHGSFQTVKTLCPPCERQVSMVGYYDKDSFIEHVLADHKSRNTGPRNYFGTVIILISFETVTKIFIMPFFEFF